MFYYLTSNNARVVDNVVVFGEPGNTFNNSYVKVGLSLDSCVYLSGHLEAKFASIIFYIYRKIPEISRPQ